MSAAEDAARELGATLVSCSELAGGDINIAQKLILSHPEHPCVFLKSLQNPPTGFYQSEAAGLSLLAAVPHVDTPKVLAVAEHYLALEYIESPTLRGQSFDKDLGHMLAELHSAPLPDHCSDGFIGTLPQDNSTLASWPEFFRDKRLAPLVELAIGKGLLDSSVGAQFATLEKRLPNLLPKHATSILHGDLWSGNVIARKGKPCLIDPATYIGHHEVDLAMMKLFGGFYPHTFAAHAERFPGESGQDERLKLYQLYPLLVHLLLFGRSYQQQVLDHVSFFG